MEVLGAHSTCHCCGAAVEASAEVCRYCENPVRISSLRSTASLSAPLLLQYLGNYQTGSGGQSAQLSIGVIFLRLGQLQKARACFDAAIQSDPVNSEAYFNRAISTLERRKPFLCARPVIDDALRDLDSAFQLEQRPIFKYLSALIKYDYFYRKGFRIDPDFGADGQIALRGGISTDEVQVLANVVNIEVPSELKIPAMVSGAINA